MVDCRVKNLFINQVGRVVWRSLEQWGGQLFHNLDSTLREMASRPYILHLELTNICNASCIFCHYQFQQRDRGYMHDQVFEKAVHDFVACGGGSVDLTPVVGESLLHPQFIEYVRYLRRFPEIDRIFVTTNGTLLDRHGIESFLTCGISHVQISTAGFDKTSYERIYRNCGYERMKENVSQLLQENARLDSQVAITIAFRTDRSYRDVIRDPDLQPLLPYGPALEYCWHFCRLNGQVAARLPKGMVLRKMPRKNEPCRFLYDGPIVRADGSIWACSCVAAMDACEALRLGDISQTTLCEAYTGERMTKLRQQFYDGDLNETCRNCDSYVNCGRYRQREGRIRARISARRRLHQIVKRAGDARRM